MRVLKLNIKNRGFKYRGYSNRTKQQGVYKQLNTGSKHTKPFSYNQTIKLHRASAAMLPLQRKNPTNMINIASLISSIQNLISQALIISSFRVHKIVVCIKNVAKNSRPAIMQGVYVRNCSETTSVFRNFVKETIPLARVAAFTAGEA